VHHATQETPSGLDPGIERTVATSAIVKLIVTFGIVGLLGALVNALGLIVLYRVVGLPIVVAAALAAELAIVHNYLLNDRWTFGYRHPSVPRFARFNLGSLAALAVNVAVLSALVMTGVPYIAAAAVGITSGAAFNLGISVAWVWAKENP
jgi:putative flippase GtrA